MGVIKRTTAFRWEMDRALGEYTIPFSYVCHNEEARIPLLREKIDAMRSGDSVTLNGIERDIITAGLDLAAQLVKAEKSETA